jgi:predicted secreted Zn-dependent protease
MLYGVTTGLAVADDPACDAREAFVALAIERLELSHRRPST